MTSVHVAALGFKGEKKILLKQIRRVSEGIHM